MRVVPRSSVWPASFAMKSCILCQSSCAMLSDASVTNTMSVLANPQAGVKGATSLKVIHIVQSKFGMTYWLFNLVSSWKNMIEYFLLPMLLEN